MAFWTEGNAQPKRNYRFKITIAGQTGNEAIWWAKGFKPPSYEVSEAAHDYLDNKYYWPGRLTWNECSMTLVDPLSPNAVGLTNELIIGSGYSIKTNTATSVAKTINRKNSNDALGGAGAIGGVIVDILDANGAVVESWELFNPFVKSVSFSDLAYDNDELRTIDISFRYDWAQCTNTSPAVPASADQFKPV